MRFIVDMPLSPGLAAWLRGRGHDAVHVFELGLDRAEDMDIISRARSERRTIITVDLDYPRLLALAEVAEPSLILFRGGAWTEAHVITRIDEILQALTETDITRSILVVERDRVRRRRLPIGSRPG